MVREMEKDTQRTDRDRLYQLADAMLDTFAGELGIFAGAARRQAQIGIAKLSEEETREAADRIRKIVCH